MPIESLAQELLKRQVDSNPGQFKQPILPSKQPQRDIISPEKAAVLGSIADAISTGTFLSRRDNGRGDDNALYRGLGGNPLATAGAVMAGGIAGHLGRNILRKVGAGRIADMLAGSQGANQLALGITNNIHPPQISAQEFVDNKIHGAFRRNK
jgi:hypothetical protein